MGMSGAGQKKIKNIMEREDGFELRDLLMEEETVSETKQNNKELLDYLCLKENLSAMISYAVEFPAD